MSTVKNIQIQDATGNSYNVRDIGSEAQYVEVSFDVNGEIIADITAPGVVVDETKGLSVVLKDMSTNTGGHEIKDSVGTTFPKRANLVFENAIVADDETNDATIVTPKGLEIELGDVSGAVATQDFDDVILTWSDPSDVVIGGSTLVYWAGTTVVRKKGSAPQSVSDGTVIVTNTTRDQYASTGYRDEGLDFGDTYYYRFFPYRMSGTTKVHTTGSAVSVVIEKTALTVPLQSGTVTYDGTVQSPTWSNYDSSQLTIGGDEDGTNAGTYTATFTPKTGYKWSDDSESAKNVDWVISKATLTPPAVTDTSKTYNGSAQNPTIAAYDNTKISVAGDSATNAGSYTVVFSLVDSNNYEWSTGAVTSVAWSIAQATGTCTLSKSSMTLDTTTLTDTVTVSDATGTVTVSSSDTTVVTATLSGNTITISSVNNTTGTATVTVSIAASVDGNYSTGTKTISATCTFTNIYGVEWAGTSSSAWTRTDAAASFTDPSPAVSNGDGSSPFDNCMPWSGMKRVTYSAAGTLVEIPKFWYKWTRTGAKMKLQISDGPQTASGWHVSPAHADRGDGKGERDKVYVGAYHCATSTYKSTTGVKPMNYQTRATFRASIHSLGSTYWQYDYAMYWTIAMLYLVEYADWNSQAKIGYGCGNNSAAENAGLTDSMIYHTGTNAVNRTTYGHTRYRYIEDLWGNVYDWCDGIYFGGTYNEEVYAIKNPANFSDTRGGTNVGRRASENGVATAWTSPSTTGFEYAIYPSATTNDYTHATYDCDRCNFGTGGVVLYVGGNDSQNQDNGLFYLNGYFADTVAPVSIGGRLQRLP